MRRCYIKYCGISVVQYSTVHIQAIVSMCFISSSDFYEIPIYICQTERLLRNVNKNPTNATVCRYLFTAKLLYMFRVSAPIIRSIKNCTRSLRYRSYYLYRYSPPTWSDRDSVPIRPRRTRVAVQVVWPVPEAAGTVFNTPNDGCWHTKHVE